MPDGGVIELEIRDDVPVLAQRPTDDPGPECAEGASSSDGGSSDEDEDDDGSDDEEESEEADLPDEKCRSLPLSPRSWNRLVSKGAVSVRLGSVRSAAEEERFAAAEEERVAAIRSFFDNVWHARQEHWCWADLDDDRALAAGGPAAGSVSN